MRRLLLLAALPACSHEPDRPSPPAPPPASAPITQGVPGSQDLAPLQQLGARLSDEKSHRPAVKVSADRVFAALAEQGITLASHHQVLASIAAASYCDLGVTGDAIAIAVCEYDSAAAAAKGKQLLDEHYGTLVPDAVRTINGTTLVTVANARSNPELRDRVIHTFMTL